MLYWIIFIPFFLIYMIILLATKSYFTIAFIFVGSYLWHRALSKTRKPPQKRDKDALEENVLIFKKGE